VTAPKIAPKIGPRIAPEIVVLTGAGISRESGLATFRDAAGVWATVRIEDVATPEAFRRDPARVHDCYNARRAQLGDPAIQPNAAHLALAELERRWPVAVTIVTQNVDDLHERAGTRSLIHMHGALNRARCRHCDSVHRWREALSLATICPGCGRDGSGRDGSGQDGGMRPDVVWFGEMPYEMDTIGQRLSACRLFVSIGTSGHVYPAAGFVAEVRGRARTIELNLEPSEGASLFDEAVHGPATLIVPDFVGGLLESLPA
jgi:NAD-dependent deacetylase